MIMTLIENDCVCVDTLCEQIQGDFQHAYVWTYVLFSKGKARIRISVIYAFLQV